MYKNIKHKLHAKPTTVDNINFSSKLEARYYQQLLLRQKAGEVIFFLRQVPFHLPGGVKYVLDFQEFHADGNVIFTDTKGMATPLYIAKKKIVEAIYPIQINVVTKEGVR